MVGQEQDSVLGTLDYNQASNVIIDTIAIYDTAWSADEVGVDRPVGVDLRRSDLYALYSGFTKGRDLVGSQDGAVSLFQFGEGMENSEATVGSSLDMLSPETVGGVAWYFPPDQTDYVIEAPSMNLPTGGFTIEMWIMLESFNSGTTYFVSYCASSNCNCLIAQDSGFSDSDVGKWNHFVMTYDAVTDNTYAYLNGTENSNLIHSEFCGATSGAFVIGQEQDSAFGSYDANQATNMYVDTVAIYSSYWDADQVAARHEDKCVDLHDPTLFTVWSGYTRGKDLVGNNDADIIAESLAKGFDSDC